MKQDSTVIVDGLKGDYKDLNGQKGKILSINGDKAMVYFKNGVTISGCCGVIMQTPIKLKNLREVNGQPIELRKPIVERIPIS